MTSAFANYLLSFKQLDGLTNLVKWIYCWQVGGNRRVQNFISTSCRASVLSLSHYTNIGGQSGERCVHDTMRGWHTWLSTFAHEWLMATSTSEKIWKKTYRDLLVSSLQYARKICRRQNEASPKHQIKWYFSYPSCWNSQPIPKHSRRPEVSWRLWFLNAPKSRRLKNHERLHFCRPWCEVNLSIYLEIKNPFHTPCVVFN